MTTEAPTTGSTTSAAEPSTPAEQAARLLAEPLPADVRIAMIQQVLHETGQALAVLQTMADLLAGQERAAAPRQDHRSSTPVRGVESGAGTSSGDGDGETLRQYNARHIKEIEDERDFNQYLAQLLLSMLDEDGAPREVDRWSEYPDLTRAAQYGNPGAVSRGGWVEVVERETEEAYKEFRVVTQKGLDWLRSKGFRVA